MTHIEAALDAYVRAARLGVLIQEHRDAIARFLGLPEWIKCDMDVAGAVGLEMLVLRVLKIAAIREPHA